MTKITDPKKANNDFLMRKLKPDGKKAFFKLCDLGSDREVLSGLLTFLCSEKVIRVERRRETKYVTEHLQKIQEGQDKYLRLAMFPLDSFDTALNGMTLRELRQVSERAKKLRKDVHKLRQTPLVKSLVRSGVLGEQDLLYSAALPFAVEIPQFKGVLELPKLARSFGSRKRPDYTRRLAAICKHIHESTGNWNDQLLTAVLYDLLPTEITPTALLRWRERHNLR